MARHMEDGCSKRFDIGTLDVRFGGYDGSHGSTRQLGAGPLNLFGHPPGGLPPISMAPLGSNSSILTSTAPPVRSRDSMAGADYSQELSWSR